MGPNVPDYPSTFPRCPPGFVIGGDYDLRPNVAPGLSILCETTLFIITGNNIS